MHVSIKCNLKCSIERGQCAQNPCTITWNDPSNIQQMALSMHGTSRVSSVEHWSLQMRYSKTEKRETKKVYKKTKNEMNEKK